MEIRTMLKRDIGIDMRLMNIFHLKQRFFSMYAGDNITNSLLYLSMDYSVVHVYDFSYCIFIYE